MNALTLVLLLAAGAADDVPPPEEASPPWREFRAGSGAMTFLGVEGVAPAAEVGVEVDRSGRLGFRFTFGAAMRMAWGSVYVAPELVFRLLPRGAPVSPYVTAGLQAAVLNITDGALGVPDRAESRAAVSGNLVRPEPTGGGGGPTPLRLSAGPQAQVGVSFPFDGTRLDVGVRYNVQVWEGKAYSGVAVLLTVVGPAPL